MSKLWGGWCDESHRAKQQPQSLWLLFKKDEVRVRTNQGQGGDKETSKKGNMRGKVILRSSWVKSIAHLILG